MLGTKWKKVCDTKIQRRMPITIAVISAMVTIASCGTPASASSGTPASDLTVLRATPHKLVLSAPLLSGKQVFEKAKRLGAEHCKKFGKVTGQPQTLLIAGSRSTELTIPCR